MPSRRTLVTATLLVSALGAGVLVARILTQSPPTTPPAYADDRPEPATSGYVSHTASTVVAVPPAAFRAWSDGSELNDVVDTGDGLAPVVGTVALRGDWDPAGDRTGDRRRVEFGDGHYLAEEVLVDTPDRFRYMIWGFTGPQRLAVRHAVAEFTYAERAGGTELTWTYAFLPTSPVTRPFVAGFVDSTIATMMRGTLEGMRTGAEREARR